MVNGRKVLRRLERLIENLHAVAAGDDDRRRQIQRVVQALDRRHGVRSQDDAVRHALHAEHADVLLHELGQDELLEAAEVRIHHVERHLHRVEREALLARHFEHVEMDVRILVPGEADVAELARLPRLEQRSVGALLVEDPVGILEADDLVMLHEIDAIGLEPRSDSSSCRVASLFERPSIFVIRKTLSRYPSRSAFPMRISLAPSL